MTGASSGIGTETARVLAVRGAPVTLAVRDADELKTIEQGGATSIFAAVSPLLDRIGGRYLEDCHEAETVLSRVDSDGRHGVAAYALDVASAERLWDLSQQQARSRYERLS